MITPTWADAEITIDAVEELVQIIEKSLHPEVEQPISERSKVEITTENSELRIRVKASDLAALRAALNSYLRWVGAILDTLENISG